MENTSRGQAGLCSIEVMMPGQLRKWFHQVFFFLLFSFAGTVTQYLILSFLPYLLGYGLASAEFMWPQKEMSLFGIDYTWSLLGYNVLSSFQPLGDGTSVLDLEDFLISSTIMPIGSLLFVLFCSRRSGWGWDGFIGEADSGKGVKFPKWLKAYVRWMLPLLIAVIFAKGYWDIFSAI